MSYWWKPGNGVFDQASLEGDGLLPRFEEKERAEEWLGLYFGDLQDRGVADVSLYEEDRLVYGPMSLDA